MMTLMITQANALKHNILEQPTTKQEPLSGMHFIINEQLKDDNLNILITTQHSPYTLVGQKTLGQY